MCGGRWSAEGSAGVVESINTLLPRASGGGGTRSVTEGVLFLRPSLLPDRQLCFRHALNRMQHALQMIPHIGRREPNHPDALFTHPRIAGLVMEKLISTMRAAIDFNDEPC